jgi:lipid II:glycine glycyltransferase (peptidoglycan interpeptide bridge formation enzyme)
MLILISQENGRLMTGLIGSIVGDMGIYLLGATSGEGMKTKGSYLLQWRMIQRLKERGCRWYDLGGINPQRNPGVFHFKSGFGGAEVLQCQSRELSGSPWSSLYVNTAEKARVLLHSAGSRFSRAAADSANGSAPLNGVPKQA